MQERNNFFDLIKHSFNISVFDKSPTLHHEEECSRTMFNERSQDHTLPCLIAPVFVPNLTILQFVHFLWQKTNRMRTTTRINAINAFVHFFKNFKDFKFVLNLVVGYIGKTFQIPLPTKYDQIRPIRPNTTNTTKYDQILIYDIQPNTTYRTT